MNGKANEKRDGIERTVAHFEAPPEVAWAELVASLCCFADFTLPAAFSPSSFSYSCFSYSCSSSIPALPWQLIKMYLNAFVASSPAPRVCNLCGFNRILRQTTTAQSARERERQTVWQIEMHVGNEHSFFGQRTNFSRVFANFPRNETSAESLKHTLFIDLGQFGALPGTDSGPSTSRV